MTKCDYVSRIRRVRSFDLHQERKGQKCFFGIFKTKYIKAEKIYGSFPELLLFTVGVKSETPSLLNMYFCRLNKSGQRHGRELCLKKIDLGHEKNLLFKKCKIVNCVSLCNFNITSQVCRYVC